MTKSFKTTFFNFFRQVFKITFLEKILLRLTIDKSETSFLAKLIPNNYQYPINSWRQVNRNGINYKLDLQDYVDWWIYFGLKEESRNKLYSLVNKDDVIIDVGANMGETLMNFAVLSGSKGWVYGFEPDSINYKRCIENLKLNSFNTISLNKTGLGDRKGQFKIKVDTPTNRAGNRITSDDDENAETIDVITLDEYVKSTQINKINLIKIDVEGFEFNVLKGAEEILEKLHPVLFIELDDVNLKQQDASAQILIKFLMEKGYVITNAYNNENVTEKNNFENCHYDIICTFSVIKN